MLNRLFGRQPAPPEESSVDYADLLNQIIEGLATGWSVDQVKACLAGQENDQKFVEWLYRYGRQEQIEPEVAERLVQWGEMDCGLVSKMAKDIGNRIPDLELIKQTEDFQPSQPTQQSEIILNEGINLLNQKNLVQAIAVFNKVLGIKSLDQRLRRKALICKGISLSKLDQFEDFISTFNQVLQLNIDNHEVFTLKATILETLSLYKEALIACEKALDCNPSHHFALFFKGNLLYIHFRQYTEAIKTLDASLRIKPDDYKCLTIKALSLQALFQHTDAITTLDKALKAKVSNKNKAQLLNIKASCLEDIGQHKEALITYDTALKTKPNYHIILKNKASLLIKIGRYKEAFAAYYTALEIIEISLQNNYNSYRLLRDKAYLLKRLEQYPEALSAYDAVLAINKDKYKILEKKAELLENLGQSKEALRAYESALDITNSALNKKPHDYQVAKGKARLLKKLERYSEALVAYDIALEITPNSHELLSSKGDLLERLQCYEDAIATYDAALQLNPYDYHNWLNRGSASIYSLPGITTFSSSIHLSSLTLQHPELQQRGYPGTLACYQVGLQYVQKSTNPLGWGLLHRKAGKTLYFHNRYNPTQLHKALAEYDQSLTTLTATAYPTEHLETLQLCIRAHLGLNQTDQVRTFRQQALAVFQDLLNQAKSDTQRRRIATQFSGLSHLQVDMLLAEGLTTEALLAAERYKNRVLTWILDHWQAQTISPSLDQIRTLLSPQTAIIYWHLSDDTLITFLITDSTPITATTQPSQPLETWLKTWTRDYNNYRATNKKALNTPADTSSPKQKGDGMSWRINLTNRLNELKTLLTIDDLTKNLTNIQNLILIPHRDLHRIPLHTLFPENLTSTYLPSVQIGLNLQTQTIPLAPLLNIDDPEIDQPSMAYTRMVYARIESEVVRQLVGQASYLGDHVTTTAASQALEEGYHTLHFTGHGEYNHRQPENSALQLSDGTLTSKHISTLDLSSYNLVCLASCETALTGTQTIDTEYVGLVSAFLKAGASNVLSTLWQIEEIESTWFIVRFYQALIDHQLPATALKTAQHWLRNVTPNELNTWLEELLTLPGLSQGTIDQLKTDVALISEKHSDSLNEPLYIDPFFWAGFTLTGRG